MMKDKRSVYILIACVAVVWSLIFYRVYSGMKDDSVETPIRMKSRRAEYFKLVDHSNDKEELDLDYADPFLQQSSSDVWEQEERMPVASISARSPIIAKLQATPINWSTILYTGHITNPSTHTHIGIFLVNGKESMLKEGETAQGLKFVKYYGDSVRVSYQNVTRFISIK